MGSHSLLVVLERLTMHLSWIFLVFQIITTQIYGKHTSNYRANLIQSTIPQHFTLYETENDTSNGVFKNIELFKKTFTNAISTMATALEKNLYNTTNTAITASRQSASPGRI